MFRHNRIGKNIYTVGGTVQAGDGIYIKRRADAELLNLCRAGRFAYVLTTRQVGKSSLLVSTSEILAREGVRCALIDLTQIGVQVTAEQWYLGLVDRITESLKLRTDFLAWWKEHSYLGLAQRLMLFVKEVCLGEVAGQVMIFIDEIDSTLSLSFSDDFYAIIRAIYHARAEEPQFQRVSFVLSGFATPSELIKEPTRTPFNIGQSVELTDFTLEEAGPLAWGLGPPPADAIRALEWILKWTGGHPYLTQCLARAVADLGEVELSEPRVNEVAADTFIRGGAANDINLLFVRDMLTRRAPDPEKVLKTYREIYRRKGGVPDDEQSRTKTHLKLSGIVRSENNRLRVRNRVYKRVFNEEWIQEHLHERAHRASAVPAVVMRRPPIPRPPVVGFVARHDKQAGDIAALLKEELLPEKRQVVSLTGPGGVGKTTLAAEAARSLEDAFEGRVVWSSADGRADYTLYTLLDDIATYLGSPDIRTLSADVKAEQVHALVAECPSLVVIDNYETVRPEAQADIEQWLEGALCSALVTSRHPVGIARNISVTAMSREEAEEFLKRLISQVQDPYVFSEDVRMRIYRTAEANPFIMQWVVGQMDAAKEPHAVLEELAMGEGDAAERVFDRSFNLPRLGEDGRAALLALSLFAPGATRDALAEVAGFGGDIGHVNNAIKNLRSLWLIRATDENRRFTVEGLTRNLAQVRLSVDNRAGEFRRRYVAYFLNYAVNHDRPTPDDLDALEAEKDNLLNAIDVAFESLDLESVRHIVTILARPSSGMLYVRGYWDEAIRCSEQALKAASMDVDRASIGQFIEYLAAIHAYRGQYKQAYAEYQQALQIFRELGRHERTAIALNNLGYLAQTLGELDEARRLYNESLEIRTKLGNEQGIATTLRQLAALAQTRGELNEAWQLYNESLNITAKLGDRWGIAGTLYALGMLAESQGELEEARQAYGDSLEITRQLGEQSGAATALQGLGRVAQMQGDIGEARRLYHESLTIMERLGDQSGIAVSFAQLGMLASYEGNKTEAARLYAEAASIFEKLGSPHATTIRELLERLEAKK